MALLDGKRKVPAIGCNERSKASKKVACLFDNETFAEIRALAVKENTSFAEQVRRVVEWGLLEKKDDAR